MDTVLNSLIWQRPSTTRQCHDSGNECKKKALNGAAVIMFPHLVLLAEKSRSSAVTGRNEDRLGVRWFLRDHHDRKGRIATLRTRQGEKTGFLVGGQYQKGAFEDLDRRPG